jgi:NodT family efflux transporter outer membrane factor (OMF) lipoprotein
MITKHSRHYLFCATLLLQGCHTTEENLPQIHNMDTLQIIAEDDQWWRAFKDPVIDKLTSILLRENSDLQVAIAHLQEAEANREKSTSSLFPSLSFQGSAVRSNKNIQKAYGQVQGGIDATWDTDIFGMNRASLDAAKAHEENAMASLHDVQNALLAECVHVAQEWRYYRNRMNLLKILVDHLDQHLVLLQAQTRAGLSDETILSQPRADLASNQTLLSLVKSDLKAKEYQLKALLNSDEHALQRLLNSMSDNTQLPQIQSVLSESVKTITNRPDIRMAQATLLAAQSDLESVEASLWPNLSLSSFFGVRDGSAIIMGPGPQAWTIASSLTLPFLDFGRIRSAVKAAGARTKQAHFTLEKTILGAFAETHSALIAYVESKNAYAHQTVALGAKQEATALALERYEKGFTGMIPFLSAQTAYDQTKLDQLAQKLNLDVAYIQLNKALAKGFKASTPNA